MESKLGSKLKDKSLVEAIEDKYGSFEEELTIQIFVPKGAPGQKGNYQLINVIKCVKTYHMHLCVIYSFSFFIGVYSDGTGFS